MENSNSSDQIMKPLMIEPSEMVFPAVTEGKTYTQKLTITNNMKFNTYVELKSGCEEKLTINPREFELGPSKTKVVTVNLRVGKPFGQKNGTKVPIKERLFVKTDHFNQSIGVFVQPDNGLEGKYFENQKEKEDQDEIQVFDEGNFQF